MKVRDRYGLSFYKGKDATTGRIRPSCIQEEGCKYKVLEFISRLTKAELKLLMNKTNIYNIVKNELKAEEKLDFIDDVDVTISYMDIIINSDYYRTEEFHGLLQEWKTFLNAENQHELKSNSLYTQHAGLVLLAPYLPVLFSQISTQVKQDRSIYLLRYIATGIEEQLVSKPCLENMLCGFSPEYIPGQIAPLTEGEKSVANSLLYAVINNWPLIQKTSIQGLRETFINRPGMLIEPEDVTGEPGRRTLAVERKPLDVLVDQVPWSFNLVYQRWMSNPLYVTW